MAAMGPRFAAALIVCFVCTSSPAEALLYKINATGYQLNSITPRYMGMGLGYGNENSNTWVWLKYLNPQMVRQFVAPLARVKEWRAFAGTQFGVSFRGAQVNSANSWWDAVGDLRRQQAVNDNFFNWLLAQKGISWSSILRALDTTSASSTYLAQNGNPEYVITQLKERGYEVMALWDIRCRSFQYLTMDRADPMYWMERWETYRLNYIGGIWFAQHGVRYIELYNEPDLEKSQGCIDPERFVDDVRIRSMGFKDSFLDYTKGEVDPVLIGGTTAGGWDPIYSPALMDKLKVTWPDEEYNNGWEAVSAWSFHKYGDFSSTPCDTFGPDCKPERGWGLRKAYDTVQDKIAESGNFFSGGTSITEFNCYTAAIADSPDHPFFAGKNVLDQSTAAACIASQVGGLISVPYNDDRVPPFAITAFKFVQTRATTGAISPSITAKNGLFFGAPAKPYDVAGSTKAGEAYRLILRKTTGEKQPWEMLSRSYSIDVSSKSVRYSLYVVHDDQAYYLYSINESWNNHDIRIGLANLPGIDPLSNVIVSCVADGVDNDGVSFHGEVCTNLELLGQDFQYEFNQLPASVYMLTFPRVPTVQLSFDAAADATLHAGSSGGNNAGNFGDQDSLLVATNPSSGSGNAAALLKFTPGFDNGLDNVVSAVLQVHLRPGGDNYDPQILTVLGFYDDFAWDEYTVSWAVVDVLTRPDAGGDNSIGDNFVNWKSDPEPIIVGALTVPRADTVDPEWGKLLRLDVTDAVKAGVKSFLLVRVFRYEFPQDAPAPLPRDEIQGSYTFDSRESDREEWRPKLLVDYQDSTRLPLPPAPPPPESPPPPPYNDPPPPPYYEPVDYSPPPPSYEPPSPIPWWNKPPPSERSPARGSTPKMPPPWWSKPPPKPKRKPPPKRKRKPPPKRKRKPPPKKASPKRRPPPRKRRPSPKKKNLPKG